MKAGLGEGGSGGDGGGGGFIETANSYPRIYLWQRKTGESYGTDEFVIRYSATNLIHISAQC